MIAGDDESGPIDVSVRRILSAEPANAMYVPRCWCEMVVLPRQVAAGLSSSLPIGAVPR